MDKLWQAYNAELAALRQLGAEFAEQHPQVAAHLSLRDEQVEDPHVSRLLEGVALQTARIRVNLDHDFPELTQALIGTLYPDYHAPVPSQSIVQFSLIEQAPAPVCIEAGSQLTTPQADKPCLFRVNDTISVLPARLSDVRWQAAPVAAPKLPKPYEAVLQAKLTPSANAQWSTITDDSLRFYISASEPASFSLYQALLNQTVGVAIAGEVNGEEAVVYLPPEALQPYGLDQASPGLDGRSSAAHHQLSDFFLFPKRFLFVELQQLISTETGFNCWAKFQHGFTLYFYCRHTDSTLSTQVNNKSLALGCASVINLFEAPVVPIPAKDVGIEALLQVDPAHSHHADIYRLKTLTAHNSRGQAQHLQPFYKTRQTQKNTTLYWTSRREPANQSYRVNTREAQVNTFVSLVDDQFEITGQKSDWIIEGRAWCTNRQWPNELLLRTKTL
ncbi:MAG: type VI secretion system baseplate subunit TssF [Limnobacter sp.]|nr:type VI secretion system baseplate subunit TssF [Limnobacter sp.]